ncbi:MAG: hypothetical protein LRZ84_15565 [Desertifilum sp.]|nr:hypothetical protein [Desertifilum sp.]
MTNKAISALMAKVKEIFTTVASEVDTEGSTFLAFTIPGIPMSPRDLDFSLSSNEAGLTPQQALNAEFNFAYQVNSIPEFSPRWNSDGRLLWSEYKTILSQALVASNQATPAEIEQLQQAKNLIKQYSDAYRVYQQAYVQAQIKYNTIKFTHASGSWNESSEKAQVDAAKNDWVNKGYKNEVDRAYVTIDQLTGRSPFLSWGEWKDQFEQSKQTDLKTNQEFYQTYFYPENFYKPDAKNQWLRLVLNSEYIEKFNSSDTGTSGDDLPISRLEVDLMRVQIVRPWLNPSLFSSEFWQWTDRRSLLSDGNPQPKGSLVAYATSIVFTRQLKIEWQSSLGENSEVVQQIKQGKSTSLGPLSLENATLSGSNSIQSQGMQILAFICEKLPKAPNPDSSLAWTGPIVVNWQDGNHTLDRTAKISQVKVTIRTGGETLPSSSDGAGTDSYVSFRVAHEDWWALDNPGNDFEANTTETYGPFNTSNFNLKVDRLFQVPVELKLEKYWADAWPAWYVEWVQLEVKVEGYDRWFAYKKWENVGWLNPSNGTNYRKLQ